MITVSLCMIVKNEEAKLNQCLSSARDIADEIVVVDTGSGDGTKGIAARYTDKIYDFEWIDDFSAARNYAFSKATMEYILWLDADDLLLPEDRERLLKLKRELSPEVDAVMMKYNTGFDEKGNVVFSYFRERLSKRSRNFQWREPVHEYLAIGGNIINTDISVTHTKKEGAHPSARNLRIYEERLAAGKPLSPRGTYYYARELKDNGRFSDAAEQFSRFLDSGLGWVEDNITACGELAKCYAALGERGKELAALTRSFSYDTPRAELCCQMGYYFKEQANYKLAAFWFGTALHLEKPKHSWGFVRHDCWGFIPAVECAVCYDRLGEYEKAEAFNELAAAYKPDAPAVAQNRRYFAQRRQAREDGADKGN